MKKKLVGVLLSTAMVASLSSYAFAKEDVKKMGVVIFQNDMFFQMWTEGVDAACEEAGWEYNNSNYEGDAGSLANLIQTYMDQDYDAIALQYSDLDTAMEYTKKAVEAGLAVGAGGLLEEEQLEYFSLGCATDPYACGKSCGELAAEYLKANNKDELKIGVVQFMAQLPFYSAARSETFLAELDAAGIKYEVVADQDASVQDEAVTVCTDMLTAHPEIDLIYAANDGATVGCTMAVKNAGMADSVMVFGCDASEQICELMLDDSYSLIATAAQDPYSFGYRLAKALIDETEGRENEDLGESVTYPALGLSDMDPEAISDYIELLAQYN